MNSSAQRKPYENPLILDAAMGRLDQVKRAFKAGVVSKEELMNMMLIPQHQYSAMVILHAWEIERP